MAAGKPSKLRFVLKQGALRGLGRGFVLSEIYTLLVAAFFVVTFLLDGGRSDEFLGFILFVTIWGQAVGVIPSLLIGLTAGFAIARLAIELSERSKAVAGKLAASVALALSLLVDLFFISENTPPDGGYLLLAGLPSLIFVFEAIRVTRQQLPKVEENFTPGGLRLATVTLFFWITVGLKLLSLAWMFL